MALSKKQRAFVDEYFKCNFNATEAYARAYQSDSRESAATGGSRLLRNVEIDAEIKRRMAEKVMGPEEVAYRLGEQARGDYSAYIQADGSVDLERLIADGKAHLIKSIKETAHGRNVEFYDGQSALIHIGKIHGIFTEQTEHVGEIVIRVKYGDEGNHSSSA